MQSRTSCASWSSRAQEVRVVRRDDGEAQLGRELEDLVVELALSSGVVGLDLEVVAVRERVRVPARRPPRAACAVVARRWPATSPAMHADETMRPSLYLASSSRSTRGLV